MDSMSESDAKQSSINPIRIGWEHAAPDYKAGLGVYLEKIGDRLAERLLPHLSFPALDLACGPGTAVSALLKGGAAGPCVGCDFSREMVSFTRDRIAGCHGVVADQDALPFAPGTFRTVVSSMGTIFSRDPFSQLQNIGRILQEGGHYGFSAWGNPEETALGAISKTVIEGWPYPFEGLIPPLETPFSEGAKEIALSMINKAGFSLVNVAADWLTFRFPNAADAARAIVGTGRFSLLLLNAPHRKTELLQRAAEAFSSHRDPASGQIALANRYHIFILVKEPGSTKKK